MKLVKLSHRPRENHCRFENLLVLLRVYSSLLFKWKQVLLFPVSFPVPESPSKDVLILNERIFPAWNELFHLGVVPYLRKLLRYGRVASPENLPNSICLVPISLLL